MCNKIAKPIKTFVHVPASRTEKWCERNRDDCAVQYRTMARVDVTTFVRSFVGPYLHTHIFAVWQTRFPIADDDGRNERSEKGEGRRTCCEILTRSPFACAWNSSMQWHIQSDIHDGKWKVCAHNGFGWIDIGRTDANCTHTCRFVYDAHGADNALNAYQNPKPNRNVPSNRTPIKPSSPIWMNLFKFVLQAYAAVSEMRVLLAWSPTHIQRQSNKWRKIRF